MPPACAANSRERPSSTIAMARMRRACLASAVRAASARNCEILKSWCVISIADMLPAPRINDMLHRVTVAVVWESPQESGSQAAGIIRDRRRGAPYVTSGRFVADEPVLGELVSKNSLLTGKKTGNFMKIGP